MESIICLILKWNKEVDRINYWTLVPVHRERIKGTEEHPWTNTYNNGKGWVKQLDQFQKYTYIPK